MIIFYSNYKKETNFKNIMSSNICDIQKNVKEYYGKILTSSQDLKTNACCNINSYDTKYLQNINDEIKNTYYGCGLVAPDFLTNCHILDLGCGTGLDVYLLSQLVGSNGKVIGVDMTQEQIDVAKKWEKWQIYKFKYSESNVKFITGYIELLDECQIESDSLDIVVSNCVVNLSYDKKRVLQEVYRVLKSGGEFYFSDVYCNKRINKTLQKDSVLWGECLSGALYWNDFQNLAVECGFIDPRIVKYNRITVNNKELEVKLSGYEFYSVTYRLFKIPNLEPDCEDYGQAVIYLGTIPGHISSWSLDDHHTFITNKVMLVCGNTWLMLRETRFQKHFQFIGNFHTHHGIFPDCGKNMPFFENNKNINNSCC